MVDGNPEGTDAATMRTASLLGLLDPQEDADTPEALEADIDVEDELEADGYDEQDEELEDDEPDEEAERTYTVKVDGEEVEVSESELLSGYSRQADYSRKTMELAERRKAMDTEFQQVQQERQLYAQYLGQLAQATQPQKPDFEAIANEKGIEAAMQVRLQYENQMERHQAVVAEQQATQQRLAAGQAQARQQWQEQEYKALLDAKPGWKDPEVYQSAAKEIEDFATGLGYTPDQLAEVSHRDILVLDAARKWFAAESKAQKVKPTQSRVARPGSKGQVRGKSKARKTKERFKKTGRVDDAADALRAIVGGAQP